MRVFKFGGASVKDAKGIQNLGAIVSKSEGKIVVVVSAMGKMTNAFEDLFKSFFENKESMWTNFEFIKQYHRDIMEQVFQSNNIIFSEIDALFFKLEDRLQKAPSLNYDFEYDQIISYGELLSTKIVSAYLNEIEVKNEWKDIRYLLKTDDQWREANVDFELSETLMAEAFNFKNSDVYVTQGFIGGTTTDMTTTLGREGSDYTAAILASILKAKQVEVWKDVPGILNADPRYHQKPVKIDALSYQEAVELTFFGAKVIHPKTIKPLQNNDIPMYVRSFLKPDAKGTLIGPDQMLPKTKRVPIYIVKPKQLLITILQPDFSFMNEENLSWIFETFYQLKMHINLIQQSALKLTVAIDKPERGGIELIEALSEEFEVRYNDGLELLTIRNYTDEAVAQELINKEVFVQQRTRSMARFIVKNKA